MRHRIFLAIAAVGLFAGCAPAAPDKTAAVGQGALPVEDEEPGLADPELCDAQDYRPLIGAHIASVTLPKGPRLRAFSVDDIITQEYIPQRTNVLYDSDGTIIEVYCS
jgi:hypothetical protein